MRRPSLALTAALALLITVTACASDDKKSSTTNGSVDSFGFVQFGSEDVEVGHLEVPIDYGDPSMGTVDLYVARHLADPAQRIGSLLVNPGGPGFGGSDFAIYAKQIYSQELLDRFDIIGWDPRGTGLSEPAIDCVDDYDLYFANTDITPDDDSERQRLIDVAQDFTDSCVDKNEMRGFLFIEAHEVLPGLGLTR